MLNKKELLNSNKKNKNIFETLKSHKKTVLKGLTGTVVVVGASFLFAGCSTQEDQEVSNMEANYSLENGLELKLADDISTSSKGNITTTQVGDITSTVTKEENSTSSVITIGDIAKIVVNSNKDSITETFEIQKTTGEKIVNLDNEGDFSFSNSTLHSDGSVSFDNKTLQISTGENGEQLIKIQNGESIECEITMTSENLTIKRNSSEIIINSEGVAISRNQATESVKKGFVLTTPDGTKITVNADGSFNVAQGEKAEYNLSNGVGTIKENGKEITISTDEINNAQKSVSITVDGKTTFNCSVDNGLTISNGDKETCSINSESFSSNVKHNYAEAEKNDGSTGITPDNTDEDNSDQDNSDQDNSDQDNSDQDNSDEDNSDQDNSDEDNSDQDNSDEDNSDQDNSDQDNSDQDNSDQDNSDQDNSDEDNSDEDNSDQDNTEPEPEPEIPSSIKDLEDEQKSDMLANFIEDYKKQIVTSLFNGIPSDSINIIGCDFDLENDKVQALIKYNNNGKNEYVVCEGNFNSDITTETFLNDKNEKAACQFKEIDSFNISNDNANDNTDNSKIYNKLVSKANLTADQVLDSSITLKKNISIVGGIGESKQATIKILVNNNGDLVYQTITFAFDKDCTIDDVLSDMKVATISSSTKTFGNEPTTIYNENFVQNSNQTQNADQTQNSNQTQNNDTQNSNQTTETESEQGM